MPGKPTSAAAAARARKKAEIDERRSKVATMLRQRVAQQDMATELGVSPGLISQDVKWLRQQWQREAAAEIADLRAEELEVLRTDERRLRRAMMEQFDINVRLAIYDRIMRIIDRRHRILGVDAASKLALVDLKQEAKALAEQYGLDPAEAVREVERLLAESKM